MWRVHKWARLIFRNGSPEPARLEQFERNPSTKRPAVVIVGPAWSRSGTARVIQNQIEYYQDRGYLTLLIAVALGPGYMRTNAIWDPIKITEGLGDLGADYVTIATLDERSYTATKYTASFRHALRGTALDWIVDMGSAAQLPDDVIRLVRQLPVALIHVNHVYTLGFSRRLRQQLVCGGNRVPIILETHDVQSHVLQERGELNPWRRRPDSLKRLIRSETALLKKANVLVHCSVDDNEFFKMHLPNKPQILVMPTIDETFVSRVNAASCPSLTDAIDLLFVGQFHRPNLAALAWFFGQVWPLIADRRYNLKVVGAVDLLVRGYQPQIYEAFRSCFVGQVADLAPFYRTARCAIAPMVSGSGISIKTIEALALGKPFVGTSKAFRGMPMEQIKEAGLREYDTPQAFADAIMGALGNQHLSGALSRAAYDRVFSAKAAFNSRDDAVRIANNARHHQETGSPSALVPSS